MDPADHSPTSPSLTHFHVSGMSNGISSFFIPSSDFCFFNLPSSTSFFFSFCISLYSSAPVPSSALCSTSLHSMALCKILFFNSWGVIVFLQASLLFGLGFCLCLRLGFVFLLGIHRLNPLGQV